MSVERLIAATRAFECQMLVVSVQVQDFHRRLRALHVGWRDAEASMPFALADWHAMMPTWTTSPASAY